VPEFQQILFERRGRVGIITLNRPEKLNAWTDRMEAEIEDALNLCKGDRGIGATVITGAGRGYCAGADISSFQQNLQGGGVMQAGSAGGRDPEGRVGFPRVALAAKPIVCAINGPAVGVGITHTLSCDARIASDRARFSFRFVKMGLTPEAGSSFLLPRIIGLTAALELCLTGRLFEADEALRLGLVSRVVPHDELLDAAIALAEEMAANPPEHLMLIKRVLHANALEPDREAALRREAQTLARAAASPAHREAVMAFIEKRPPRFYPE